MNIQASLKIDQKQLEKELAKEVSRLVKRSIPAIQKNLNQQLPALIKKHLTANVQPVTANDYYAIGVPTINQDLEVILDTASRSFEVRVFPADLLKIDIGVLETSHSELLALPEAYFQYSSSKGSGILRWLQWILLEGNNPVVDGFDVNFNRSRFSRTGGATMRKGNFFNVPDNLRG